MKTNLTVLRKLMHFGGTQISKWSLNAQRKDTPSDVTPKWRILLLKADTE
jgi:hypothetical protein